MTRRGGNTRHSRRAAALRDLLPAKRQRGRGGELKRGPRRNAIVLVIVLVVVVILSFAAYTFTDLMQANRRAAIMAGKQIQARQLVESGIEAIKLYLISPESARLDMGGHFDNPQYFQAAPVIPGLDAADRGSFTIIAPLEDEFTGEMGVRYGLEDESSRLNLNLLLLADRLNPGTGRTLLMALPNMTEDTADAILDWIDEDAEPREYGAEDEYYTTLQPPYYPRNAIPATVEELLLVRGVTPDLLFGTDYNRNGIQDANEVIGAPGAAGLGAAGIGAAGGGMTAMPSATSDSSSLSIMDPTVFFRGWSRYLTLYSAEGNTRMDGTPRIKLNNPDLTALSQELSEVFDESWTNFILAYRVYGAASGQGGSGQGSGGSGSSGGGFGGGGSGGGSGGGGSGGQSSGRGGEEEESVRGGSGRSGGSGQGGNSLPPQIIDPADLELDLSQQPRGTFVQVLDLIGKQVQFTANGRQMIVQSPFSDDPAEMADYLPQLMENCTASDAEVIPGRININEAPREILLGIPGMQEEIVDAILSARAEALDLSDPGRQYETWLLTEGIVTLDEMRALTPFINGGGDVFRAQVVGYYQGGGPSSRAEVVFDATGPMPRLLFWRDISHLGRGYALEMLGVELDGVQ